ncbi:RICIN domain-containing protein [Streptomyces sp. Qhu-G9]|uniref:RICIN domain-containing protein n=1 Tax=Streptomyces sp. Qhu-G9 TaxID=3452799 RepID=UPI0022ABD47D|nr:RICIN domain-containing protein [Streptomyces aurantiacus]WAU82389.1 RICIN domain-containing protein [Streptomyces aurantiacus]
MSAAQASADWPKPGPFYQIASLDPTHAGKCLQMDATPIMGNRGGEGQWVIAAPCSSSPVSAAQRWEPIHNSDGTAQLRNPATGKCLSHDRLYSEFDGAVCAWPEAPARNNSFAYDSKTQQIKNDHFLKATGGNFGTEPWSGCLDLQENGFLSNDTCDTIPQSQLFEVRVGTAPSGS